MAAIDKIRTLVKETNAYINANPNAMDGLLIQGVVRWISDMLKMLGLQHEEDVGAIDWKGPSRRLVEHRVCQVLPFVCIYKLTIFRHHFLTLRPSPRTETLFAELPNQPPRRWGRNYSSFLINSEMSFSHRWVYS